MTDQISISDNISDESIIELLINMGVDGATEIKTSDIAKIKVVGRRAMREYVKKTYLDKSK